MTEPDQSAQNGRFPAKSLDTAVWGLLLVWVGFAVLANLGWGAGLLGAGIVGLAAQAVRAAYFGLPAEGIGLVVATLFVVAGAWELLKTYLGQAPIAGGLMPILSIVVGIVLIVLAFSRKARN
jgi:hypothetical protein